MSISEDSKIKSFELDLEEVKKVYKEAECKRDIAKSIIRIIER